MKDTRRRCPSAARGGAACLGAVLGGAVLLAGGEAAATISVTQVQVNAPDGGTGRSNYPDTAMYWISYQDCLQNTQFQFTVTSTGGSVEVGASVSYDCSNSTTVTTGSLPVDVCNYHYPETVASGSTITIGAQDLVAGTLGISVTGADACLASTAPAGSALVWPQPITIYFYLPVAGGVATDVAKWPASPQTMDIALVGPGSPSPVGLSVGDQELVLSLPTMPTDSNTQGYYVFCYPCGAAGACNTSDAGTGGTGGSTTTSTSTTSTSTTSTSTTSTSTTTTTTTTTGGTGGTDAGTGGTDAGTGGTGGTGGATTTTTTLATGMNDCPANVAIPGLNAQQPDINSPYVCGSLVPSTTSSYPIQALNLSCTPLADGTTYMVGVAAYDQVFNLGPLAPLQCGTPQAIDSFFPTYCQEGGPGCMSSCGSCDVGSGAPPLWPALGAGVLAGAAVMVRRRRRRDGEPGRGSPNPSGRDGAEERG